MGIMIILETYFCLEMESIVKALSQGKPISTLSLDLHLHAKNVVNKDMLAALECIGTIDLVWLELSEATLVHSKLK